MRQQSGWTLNRETDSLGHTSNAWCTKCTRPGLHHAPLTSSANHDGFWTIERDQAVNCLCDLACNVLDNDRKLAVGVVLNTLLLDEPHELSRILAILIMVFVRCVCDSGVCE